MLSKVIRAGAKLGVRTFAFRRVAAATCAAPAAGEGAEPGVERRAAEIERASAAQVEAARREGREEAAMTARAEARTALGEEIERLARTVAELAALRPRLRREAEADLVRLAVAIAGRILRREITLDPDAIGGILKAALERLAGQEIARVRVHVSHQEMVRACLASLAPAQAIPVVADTSLAPGGAVFETVRGKLDVSIDAQLAEIERGLADRLARSA